METKENNDYITVSVKDIDSKIKELEEESNCYDSIYCEGLIHGLLAVKNNNIQSL